MKFWEDNHYQGSKKEVIFTPKSKIVKLNLAKKKPKAPVLANDELFAAIKDILNKNDDNALIKTLGEAIAKVSKLMIAKFPESRILNYGHGELFYILYRGCRCDQLAMNLVFGSADGQAINYEIRKPSEEEARGQVGEKSSLPELTSNKSICTGFGTSNFCVAFRINSKYLTSGSCTESGFVALGCAPVEVLAILHGRRF